MTHDGYIKRFINFASIILLLLLSAAADAQVVVHNANAAIRENNITGEQGFVLTASRCPTPNPFSPICSGLFTVMRLEGDTLHPVNIGLDLAAEWYVANPRDTFSPATVRNLTALITLPDVQFHPPVVVGSEDFYLAMRTSITYSNFQAFSVYGWLRLRPDGDDIPTLVENAIAYNVDGIIVGTTTPIVPESATLYYFLFMLAYCYIKRRGRLAKYASGCHAD